MPDTNAPPPVPQPAQQDEKSRLGRHIRTKARYAAEFARAGLYRQADQLYDCTTHEVLAGCTHCGKTWWVKSRCRMRVCPICSYKETVRRSKFIERMTAKSTHIRMLTLTTPLCKDDPREGVKRLHAQWTKLRHRALFKSVRGGCYQIELKRKPEGWHIHLHALLDSAFLPYQKIWSAWREITGNPHPQVDIRAADNAQAKMYVAKYASKSAGFEDMAAVVVEWWQATRGLKLWGTFGTWYDAEIEEKENAEDAEPKAPPCPHCGKENTTFFARDGPRVFGPELWKTLEQTYLKTWMDDKKVRDEWKDEIDLQLYPDDWTNTPAPEQETFSL